MVRRAALEMKSTGYRMDAADERKVTQNCTRTCVAECKKCAPGFLDLLSLRCVPTRAFSRDLDFCSFVLLPAKIA